MMHAFMHVVFLGCHAITLTLASRCSSLRSSANHLGLRKFDFAFGDDVQFFFAAGFRFTATFFFTPPPTALTRGLVSFFFLPWAILPSAQRQFSIRQGMQLLLSMCDWSQLDQAYARQSTLLL